MQTAKLGVYDVSRPICARNPFGGYAHAGSLMKACFTDEKIAETLQACSAYGINTALIETEDDISRALDLYESRVGQRIQWICQDQPGLVCLLHLRRFFTEVVPFHRMQPAPEVVLAEDTSPGLRQLPLATASGDGAVHLSLPRDKERNAQ